MKKRPLRIVMYKDKKQEFRFRVVAPNGKILVWSEGYTTLRRAMDAVNLIQNSRAWIFEFELLK
jgi:uncharacterized protein YegP (UPF0339 family)